MRWRQRLRRYPSAGPTTGIPAKDLNSLDGTLVCGYKGLGRLNLFRTLKGFPCSSSLSPAKASFRAAKAPSVCLCYANPRSGQSWHLPVLYRGWPVPLSAISFVLPPLPLRPPFQSRPVPSCAASSASSCASRLASFKDKGGLFLLANLEAFNRCDTVGELVLYELAFCLDAFEILGHELTAQGGHLQLNIQGLLVKGVKILVMSRLNSGTCGTRIGYGNLCLSQRIQPLFCLSLKFYLFTQEPGLLLLNADILIGDSLVDGRGLFGQAQPLFDAQSLVVPLALEFFDVRRLSCCLNGEITLGVFQAPAAFALGRLTALQRRLCD